MERLQKIIAESGFTSRRKAEELINSGKVYVNGVKVTELGTKASFGDLIVVNGVTLNKADYVYFLLNKPRGVISSAADDKKRKTVVDLIDTDKRIYPIGRLDKNSQGLILLTNDGALVNNILKASNYHEKEYEVTVNKRITNEFIHNMRNPVPLDEINAVTRRCKVTKEGPDQFRIILTQGLNRQIRRMCEYFGYRVTKLKRVRIMNIELGNLKEGRYRKLTPDELRELKKELKSE